MPADVAGRRIHHRLDLLRREGARKRKIRRNRGAARVEALTDSAAHILPGNAQPVEVAEAALFLAEQRLVDPRFIGGPGRCADEPRCVLGLLYGEASSKG